MSDRKPADDRPKDEPRPAKRPYRTPHLERYGHVSKLTQSGGSTRFEPGNDNMMAQCL